MDFPNSVIPEPLNTDNLVPTTNPFEISNPNAGLIDLSLSPSISSPSPNRDPFANGIMPQGRASSEALAAPLFFDATKSQGDASSEALAAPTNFGQIDLERFTNSPFFGQLGYNPKESWESQDKKYKELEDASFKKKLINYGVITGIISILIFLTFLIIKKYKKLHFKVLSSRKMHDDYLIKMSKIKRSKNHVYFFISNEFYDIGQELIFDANSIKIKNKNGNFYVEFV
jgi:hypothetical protein